MCSFSSQLFPKLHSMCVAGCWCFIDDVCVDSQSNVLNYYLWCFSCYGAVSQSICISVQICHFFLSRLMSHSLLSVCHSGGRTITVTGQGFDLVQSVTMQVEGIGPTVSNWPCCLYFNHIIKPMEIYSQVKQNGKYQCSLCQVVTC